MQQFPFDVEALDLAWEWRRTVAIIWEIFLAMDPKTKMLWANHNNDELVVDWCILGNELCQLTYCKLFMWELKYLIVWIDLFNKGEKQVQQPLNQFKSLTQKYYQAIREMDNSCRRVSQIREINNWISTPWNKLAMHMSTLTKSINHLK